MSGLLFSRFRCSIRANIYVTLWLCLHFSSNPLTKRLSLLFWKISDFFSPMLEMCVLSVLLLTCSRIRHKSVFTFGYLSV